MSTTSDPRPRASAQPGKSPPDRAKSRVLYPTDFSPSGIEGIGYATALARERDATLVIAHVEEPMETYLVGSEFAGPFEELRDQLRTNLETIVPTDSNVPFHHVYATGVTDTAAGILQIAESENVDLIVMGTHGRTGLRRVLMGSVTEKVVRTAKCPVVTFTAGAAEHELERKA
jgi:nucleotide-binding universal stress UspA family protein